MAWTYAALNAAVAALSPMPSDLSGQANAINAQTKTVVNPLSWKAIKTVVQISLSWSKVVLRSRLSDGSAANLAAINAVETDDALIIDPANSGAVSTVQAGLGALLAAGDITLADVSAINALFAAVAVPLWVPAVTTGDIQTALNQP